MRIAVLSTSTYASPPLFYGGEVYFWDLAFCLAELGHQVTLYAAPGSLIPPGGELRYIPGSYGGVSDIAESFLVKWYLGAILESDLILDCSHSKPVAEEIFYYRPEHIKKILNILNGVVSHVPRPAYNIVVGSKIWKRMLLEGHSQFHGTPHAQIMGDSLAPLREDQIAGICRWSVNTDLYVPGNGRGDYLFFPSRPTPYKGLHIALDVVEATGIPLKVMVSSEHGEHRFWADAYSHRMKKMPNVEAIDLPRNSSYHQRKIELYQKARAIIAPLESNEPFGMVLVESLACGTPIITSTLGACPEIVRHGETGFLCSTLDDYIRAADDVKHLNPEDCRVDAVERWDRHVSAREMLDVAKEVRDA